MTPETLRMLADIRERGLGLADRMCCELREAADEIERLRAAISEARQMELR